VAAIVRSSRRSIPEAGGCDLQDIQTGRPDSAEDVHTPLGEALLQSFDSLWVSHSGGGEIASVTGCSDPAFIA